MTRLGSPNVSHPQVERSNRRLEEMGLSVRGDYETRYGPTADDTYGAPCLCAGPVGAPPGGRTL